MRKRLSSPAARRKGEPTIALINIVFLMLIFFLIAGTLAPALDGELSLVKISDLDGKEPPDALVILADGRMTYQGQPTTINDYYNLKRQETLSDAEVLSIRIVPDRDLPARELVDIANQLKASGANRVIVVTEKAL